MTTMPANPTPAEGVVVPCGPKPSDCVQFPIAHGNAYFIVYRCKKCGSEEWL